MTYRGGLLTSIFALFVPLRLKEPEIQRRGTKSAKKFSDIELTHLEPVRDGESSEKECLMSGSLEPTVRGRGRAGSFAPTGCFRPLCPQYNGLATTDSQTSGVGVILA